MSQTNNSPSQLSVAYVCCLIKEHQSCPSLTAKQIETLASSKNTSIPESIIKAIRETRYYQEVGEITPESLAGIPPESRKPIHHLFYNFYIHQA